MAHQFAMPKRPGDQAVLRSALRTAVRPPGWRAITAPRVGVRNTAYRRLVGTGIAAVSEEASGILSSDTVESGRKRLLQCLDGARRDPAQIGLHLGPGGLDRAEVGAVGRQIAIGQA